MSLVQSALFQIGDCNRETLRWAGRMGSFQQAWDEWYNGPELAHVLVRVGFPFDEVVADALDVAKDHIVLRVELSHIISARTSIEAYNVWARLCQLTGIMEDEVADTLKSKFDLPTFAERLMEVL